MTHSFVLRNFPNHHIGRVVRHFQFVDSTNSCAAALGDDPANHGAVVLADEQSAGRGQFGRRWQAPANTSVLMSIVLLPPPELRRPALLTAWAANAVCATVARLTDRPPLIKWPNDIQLNGRKICGILIEQGKAIVVGIGMNIAQADEDFERAGLPGAGSLRSITGYAFLPNAVSDMLIHQLDQDYDALVQGDVGTLEACWQERLGLLHKQVLAQDNDGNRYRGRVCELGFDAVVLENGGTLSRLVPEAIRSLIEI